MIRKKELNLSAFPHSRFSSDREFQNNYPSLCGRFLKVEKRNPKDVYGSRVGTRWFVGTGPRHSGGTAPGHHLSTAGGHAFETPGLCFEIDNPRYLWSICDVSNLEMG